MTLRLMLYHAPFGTRDPNPNGLPNLPLVNR